MQAVYRSEVNRDVEPAAPGEFQPLRLGTLEVWPPVVLAPMAGVTNFPFRDLCRRFGAGLYVSEMITARALVERNEKTLRLAGFDPDERPRSLQLYGIDPHYAGEAVAYLVGEDLGKTRGLRPPPPPIRCSAGRPPPDRPRPPHRAASSLPDDSDVLHG